MQETKPASFWSIFTNPLAALNALSIHPRWLFPVFLSATVSVVANLYIIHRIGFIRMIQTAAQSNGMIDLDGAIQSATAHQTQILCFQAISAFISAFLVPLGISLIFWLLLIMFRQDIPYKIILAIVAHVNLLSVILRQGMLALTVSILREPDAFNLKNPLATNLAFFLQPASPTAFHLLSSLDILTFLTLALLILGLTKACRDLSVQTAAVTVILPWILYVGVTLLAPSLGS
jgi:hypothetical protein